VKKYPGDSSNANFVGQPGVKHLKDICEVKGIIADNYSEFKTA
jgi:hypothetical protein